MKSGLKVHKQKNWDPTPLMPLMYASDPSSSKCSVTGDMVTPQFFTPGKVRWMDGSTIIPPAEIFCKIAVKSWDCHFCILVLYSQSHLVNILEHRVCTPQPIAVASLRSRARLQRFPRMQEVFSICWSLLDIGEEGKVERKRKPKLNSFSTDISQVRKEKNRKCF